MFLKSSCDINVEMLCSRMFEWKYNGLENKLHALKTIDVDEFPAFSYNEHNL